MPLKNEGVYLFTNQRLKLTDPELGLDVDLPFDPVLLPEKPQWGQEVADGFFVAGNVSATEFFIEKCGTPHGQCRLYYPSKTVKGEMYYVDGRLHGPSTFFSEGGGVLASSWFLHGVQEGKVLWYYPSGQLYSCQRFNAGRRDGEQEYFHPCGGLRVQLTYKQGELISRCCLSAEEVKN